MGYGNDQYFNLNDPDQTGEDIRHTVRNSSGYNIVADNPVFRYPDRAIRTNDHEGVSTQYLKRGYIRSLPISTGSSGVYSSKKCQFQFNPSSLTQSVQQNPSFLNFIQQDPAQYAQPMPGNVNFTFSLMFDRSMELNNSTDQHRLDADSPWEKSAPQKVGVLRDLAAFYSVIGQGLSADQEAYATEALNRSITLESNNSGSDTDLGSVTAAVPDFLSMNVGNSAFLLPLPVRVIFSSLYIVEGLVTNTTVTFTKFNTHMVPMQCVLNVTMEAKYIGFAKKDTFLSWTLAQAAEEQRQEQEAEESRKQALYNAFSSTVPSVQLALDGTDEEELVTYPEEFNWNEFEIMAPGPLTRPLPVWLFTRIPDAIPNVGFGPHQANTVSRLFSEDVSINIGVSARMQIYGPFHNIGVGDTSDTRLAAKIKSGEGDLLLSTSMVTGSGTNSRATDLDSWQKMVKSARSSIQKTKLNTDEYDDTYSEGYYIYKVEASMAVSSEGTSLTGTGTSYFIRRGMGFNQDRNLEFNVPLTWPIIVAPSEDNTSVVPPDNAATAQPVAGAVSSVGSTSLGTNGNSFTTVTVT